MSSSLRTLLVAVALTVAGSLSVAALVIAANRQTVLLGYPSAAVANPAGQPEIATSGDAVVSKRPDLAIVSAGVQSQQSTAGAAQSDLASKTARLVARIKSLGVADADLSTAGYAIGPVYSPGGDSITSYRASEQLIVKWHTVDTVGRTVDAIVQDGGATNLSVGFTLNDPKPAEAEARSLAITDAHSRAQAMASAAGVRLGQVLLVSDLGGRVPTPVAYAGAAVAAPTQIPVGQLDVQVSVEVDYAIA